MNKTADLIYQIITTKPWLGPWNKSGLDLYHDIEYAVMVFESVEPGRPVTAEEVANARSYFLSVEIDDIGLLHEIRPIYNRVMLWQS